MATRTRLIAAGALTVGAALTAAPGGHAAAVTGVFHRPVAVVGSNQSSNWSGYNQGTLEQGNNKQFTSITGTWKVPTATQHKAGQAEYAATWIGIGGGCVDAGCTVTDNTLIQTGTEEDVNSSGKASYSAWWEIIPEPSTTFSGFTVKPGDTMYASIATTSPGQWLIVLKDLTSGKSVSKSTPYSSSEDTAEWILETPLIIGSNGTGVSAMPNLGSVHFDRATTDGKPAGLKSSEEMVLVNGNGQTLATPSSPDPDTDGFNDCTYRTSCAAPTSS